MHPRNIPNGQIEKKPIKAIKKTQIEKESIKNISRVQIERKAIKNISKSPNRKYLKQEHFQKPT